jgi:hypothetical protein
LPAGAGETEDMTVNLSLAPLRVRATRLLRGHPCPAQAG